MAIKYLVEVFLPAAQKTFDMRIPATSRMGEITSLVAALAADLSEGSYKATKQSILVDAQSGNMYDVNMTAMAQGVQNGTQFILI